MATPGTGRVAARLRARIRGVLVAVYAAASMAVLFVLLLPAMAATRSADPSIVLARHLWARAGLWLAGVRLRATLTAPLPPGPAVYVSNHESALDPWILLRVVDRNVRFVAKQELFRIPVFGWYLRLARFIPVDRRDHDRSVASLRRGAAIVRAGVSLITFPEGTRSAEGIVRSFKKGPFVLAMEAGVPVVPVAIVGAGALNPKAILAVTPGEVQVRIGASIPPGRFEHRDDLVREARRQIIELHVAAGGRGGDHEDAIAGRGTEAAG